MKVLIAIHGSHSQPEHMQAQRETWLADLQRADYKYFLGASPVSNDAVDEVVAPDDVIYLPSPDGPIWEGHRRTWHLNRKTEALVKYALDGDYDFVFKCDDDTYVPSTERLLFESGFEAHDYSGFTETHWAPDTGPYRWAQGGAGYWLSRKSMEIIAEHGLHLVRAEDFAVGQLLAVHGIHPHHDVRYNPAATEQDFRNQSQFFTLHKVSPTLMRNLHDNSR